MSVSLPDGRIKVIGATENQSWRERHEAQKRARAERIKDPALRARYEARQQEKAAREAEREAQKEARIQERVREKILHETYKQLGIEEDYIQNKQAQIDAAKANNPRSSEGGSLGRLQTQEQVAMGAGGSAAADGKEMRGIGKDIALTAGGAIITAAGGLEAIATPLIGEAAFAAMVEAIGMIASASFFGPAVAIGTIAILAKKLLKKSKARTANQADQAQKLDDWQKELDTFKKQLDTVQSQLLASQDEMVAKYKTMKKGEFNAYLKSHVAKLLKEAGLTAEAEATNEAAQKIAEQVEAEADNAAENSGPEAEGEGLNSEASEATAEGAGQEEEAPEGPKSEGMVEPTGVEADGGVYENGEEKPAPVIKTLSEEELAAEIQSMRDEGIIENPEEKDSQIQEQIRRLAEEKQKTESQIMEENVVGKGE